MKTYSNRRAVLVGAVALGLLPALPAAALTTNEAQSLVQSAVGEINQAIATSRSDAAIYNDFERIFAQYADVSTIARSTLGPDARRASQAQLNAFASAFQGYIARKYGRRFREFIGGEVIVQSTQPVKSYYEVRSTVNLRGEPPFEVIFLVSDRSGRPLFFDMYIEGISLLRTERTEIGAMLDARGGDIDAMISDLRATA